MKRLAKVIGLIGGAVAVVWAMRDRFISVATPREPDPPSFRSHAAKSPPVTAIDGIGPVFAQRLTDSGIGDVATLAGSSPDQVAEAASVSAARARSWIELAEQHD
jgi:predicted flap endonuclease-1-like 5' DNA nuclease